MPEREHGRTRQRVGVLLHAIGHAANILVLLAALVYAFGAILWMHAPAVAALLNIATMAALPLGLAWLCRRIGILLQQPPSTVASSPARRRLLIGGGLAVAAACATLVHTGVTVYRCNVDRSRNAAAHDIETRRNGYERVCPGDLGRFEISFRPIESVTRKLAFQPIDLAHTPFARFEPLGGRVETVGDVASIVYRGFRLPDGHVLTLQEHDMSADGVSSWRDPKDEPEHVNGLPARLFVMEAPSGAAVSHLSWVQGRRDIQLWIDANVVREPLRERLFALAASLPAAVPACPNEPPPKPWRFDANGRRIEEPMPAMMSQADFDALSAPRPCK